jgi:formamidopyrimidine-DNA glycosylase
VITSHREQASRRGVKSTAHRPRPKIEVVPELPEVETIRRDLEPLVTGRTITAIDVDPGTIQLLAGAPIETLRENLAGRRIESLGRRGKYLLFGLDDGRVFVVHLRMTGRLVWRRREAPPEQWQRAVMELDNGFDVRWSDLRKFGTWRIHQSADEVIQKLGPEPIDAELTLKQFRERLARRTAPVKAVLLDQRRFAGLGNIYVDEALYEAGIRPDTPAGLVSPAAVKRLYASARSVLERGIANRGASFKDYVDGQGEQGTQHMYVQVFRRTGLPCYRCGTTITRTVVGGRSTHYCPKCQPKSRVRAGRG